MLYRIHEANPSDGQVKLSEEMQFCPLLVSADFDNCI